MKRTGVQLQQVRFRRRLAYPDAYIPKVPGQTGKKDHSSYFQRAVKAWLGPRNARGEYFRNKYYYPPQDHKPNYIVQDGKTVPESQGGLVKKMPNPLRNSSLHPFPENLDCKTASMVPHELKSRIYEEAANGALLQVVAQRYGLKLARVEAIIKLYEIEQDWKQNVCMKFNGKMMRLFFIFD